MRWIALTGGIASGKSTVANLFLGRGVPVVDADLLAKEVVAPGTPGLASVVAAFGPEFLSANQTLDRAKLAAEVFTNPIRLTKLEAILHPLIQTRTAELRADAEKQGHEFAIYDVPLLFEKKLQAQFDGIVTVWTPESLQLQRLQLRNGLTLAEAKLRLKAQISIEEKKKNSTWVIDNSGDTVQLQKGFERVFLSIKNTK